MNKSSHQKPQEATSLFTFNSRVSKSNELPKNFINDQNRQQTIDFNSNNYFSNFKQGVDSNYKDQEPKIPIREEHYFSRSVPRMATNGIAIASDDYMSNTSRSRARNGGSQQLLSKSNRKGPIISKAETKKPIKSARKIRSPQNMNSIIGQKSGGIKSREGSQLAVSQRSSFTMKEALKDSPWPSS